MGRRYEETLAEIEYDGIVTLNLEAIATPLTARLRAKGCAFDAVGAVDEAELQFLSRGLILTVMRDPATPNRIRIAAETPIDHAPGRSAAATRLTAATVAVRQFIDNLPAEQVTWRHKGKTYITASNRETVVIAPVVRSAMAVHHDTQPLATLADTAPRPDPDHDILARQRALMHDTMPPLRKPAHRIARASGARPSAAVPACASLPEKLAVCAINTTVMILSAPVGAGLVTYSLLRGGTVTSSSRALAVTGTALGLTALPATQSLASGAQGLVAKPDFLSASAIELMAAAPIELLAATLRVVGLL